MVGTEAASLLNTEFLLTWHMRAKQPQRTHRSCGEQVSQPHVHYEQHFKLGNIILRNRTAKAPLATSP
jgi:hypothetical protein